MEFAQQIALILLAAALIPLVFRFIDGRREKREKDIEHRRNLQQKLFEADLARQSKIIDAQDALLRHFSQQLWRFRYLAMAVSYYNPVDDPTRSHEAVKESDEIPRNIFNEVREDISESRRLVSEKAYAQLRDFYETEMVRFDKKEVKKVIQTNHGHQELNDKIFGEFTEKVEEVIYCLSKEVQLTATQMQMLGSATLDD